MEFDTVLQKVIALAGEQFPDDKQKIGKASTASDIAAWNSLSHVMFIAGIERSFGIKFDLLQMIDMKSVSDIARATFDMLK
ncbi:MAG: acyl carrier protein [Bacteroidales bacterium]|nr:acyl carrier protein [Bacteroidales bacterium]